MHKYAVVFIGGSVENTPKVGSIYGSLGKHFNKVELLTLSKYGYEEGYSYPYDAVNKPLKCLKFFYASLLIMLRLVINRPDMVYAINPLGGLVTLFYSILFNKKYCYESLEVFVGSKNPLVQGKLRRQLFYGLESRVAKSAYRFIATDPFRIKFLRRYYKIDPMKSFFLFNTYSFATNLNLQKLSSSRRPIISYCGLLMPGREIEKIISGYASSGVGGELWFVGGWNSEAYKDLLLELAKHCGIVDRVVFWGQVSNQELKEKMAVSDITFAFYRRDCLNNRLCSPNKFFDAIGCATHLITGDYPLARFLGRNGAKVHAIRKITVEHIASAIQKLSSDPSVHTKLPKILNEFSWEVEEKKLFEYVVF